MSEAVEIAVVGSGMCGMTTALALARHGHRITVYERDPAPPEGNADAAFFEWQRLGAAQFRHPHAFLGLMCNLLRDNYPDLLDAFYAAGARRVGFEDMLPPHLKANYQPEPGDDRFWVLLCRRATMETVIRRYVETLPNVTIRNRVHVVGLLTEARDGALVATGIEIRDRADEAAGNEAVHADLVIDASGRGTRFPAMLRELGREVREETEDAEIIYYTRHYRLKEGQGEPARGDNRGAGDLGYLKYGVFPGDNGHFAIIMCVPDSEPALKEAVRDPDTFDRMCRLIPGLEPWIERSEPTTESFGFGDIKSVWRYYVEGDRPLIQNFFAVGDATLRTNPLYGRGCSTGIMHAHMLAEVLQDTADPRERAIRFDARTRAELRPIYDASLTEDRNGTKRALAIMSGQAVDRPDSLKKWFGLAFGDALMAAARDEIHVMRGMMRTFHLLERPGAFLKDPRIRRTVFRYMLKGRRRNASKRLQSGPSRSDMLELVGARQAA
ncbi:MAG: FAD-dependent oxidoreductase [Pseudomonadales bacterium]|nr:FAD-dependent oxidoreductase [Pseudomonadales bacterium]